MLFWLALAALLLAALSALMFLANRRLYRPLPLLPTGAAATAGLPSVSVLIPARNEERVIGAAVAAAAACHGVTAEIVVLDDHSTDRTAALVQKAAAQDSRIRLISAPPLPPGWCGKKFACVVPGDAASHELFVFLDADVRLEPDALARIARHMQSDAAALASGFPRQETGTLLEILLIPLIHFLLLGYLPMARMRKYRTVPAYAAGCGQLFVMRRTDFERTGGHALVQNSLHDGIKLPRAFRRAGLATDLFDATDLATCRMYTRAADVWQGLAKNATEGLASSLLMLVVWTLLLGLGHVAPLPLFVWALVQMGQGSAGPELAMAGGAVVLSYVPRMLAVPAFRQSLLGALLHPLGVLVLIALQWYAWFRQRLGLASAWKGRAYPAAGTTVAASTPGEAT